MRRCSTALDSSVPATTEAAARACSWRCRVPAAPTCRSRWARRWARRGRRLCQRQSVTTPLRSELMPSPSQRALYASAQCKPGMRRGTLCAHGNSEVHGMSDRAAALHCCGTQADIRLLDEEFSRVLGQSREAAGYKSLFTLVYMFYLLKVLHDQGKFTVAGECCHAVGARYSCFWDGGGGGGGGGWAGVVCR